MQAFDAYLQQTLTDASLTPQERKQRLVDVLAAPGAGDCQPPGREDHLLPLLVTAAAAGYRAGSTMFSGELLGFQTSGFDFSQ